MIRHSFIALAVMAVASVSNAQNKGEQIGSSRGDKSQGVIMHKDTTTGPLVSVGEDGKLVYKPYTDRGDKIIDFSHCGYKASEEPIPFVPVAVTLKPPPGEAKADGTMAYPLGPDSRERIQAALDKVAAMEPGNGGFRGTVFLSKGTYYVNGGLFMKSGVVLRGEGERGFGTILVFRNPGKTAISMGTDAAKIEDLEPVVRIADAYVPAGSMQVTLEDASAFKVGDAIHLRKTVNQDWIDLLGMDDPGTKKKTGQKARPWTPETYRLTHVRRITEIEGNTITMEAPLPKSFAKVHGGGEVNKISLTGYHGLMGLEGLRIVGNYDTAIQSDVRGSDVAYPADEEHSLGTGVGIIRGINAWVRGVTVVHARNSAVLMGDSLYVTVRDCKSLKPISVIRGGRRYSFSNSDSSMTLVYNCFAEEGRHDFVTGSRDSGPIAFVKGRTENAKAASETHQRWASGVLFDSVTMVDGGGIAVANRGPAGSGHGWSGANGVVWNCTAPFIKVENPQSPEQNFAIGCTATATADARWTGVIGDGHIESVGTPVEPASLFEQQLIDRIGEDRAYRVLTQTLSKASLPMKIMRPIPLLQGELGAPPPPEQLAFEKADRRAWRPVMSDEGTGDWTRKWFLDGEGKATVTNTTKGMELRALDDHMVLWTKQSFEGDLKIEYEFTRTDEEGGGVCIIYIQATGSGEEGFDKDITKWNDYRREPGMGKYFQNMHTYHVSYACGYVRGRRYMPTIKKMNTYTELTPEYVVNEREFFEPGVPYEITIIKTDLEIRMKAAGAGKALYFILDNKKCPAIAEGRIGLRQMRSRWSRYRNFRVSEAAE